MKKVLVVMALLAPFAVMMAVAVPVNNSTHMLPSDIQITVMPEEVELKADELDPFSGTWGAGVRLEGNKTAVKLAHPTPLTITEVGYYPIVWGWDTLNYAHEGRMVVIEPTLSGYPSEEPSGELGEVVCAAYTFENVNWFNIDDIVIPAGDSFFVAVEITDDSYKPDSIPGYPAAANDFAQPVHHQSWAYLEFSEGPQWAKYDEIHFTGQDWFWGDSADIIIRCKGDAAGIGEVVLGPNGIIDVKPIITASTGNINYTLPEAGSIEIALWDAAGRHVETLYTGHSDAGEHTIAWDASNLASGAYFIRLNALNTVRVAKLVLVN